MERIGDEMARKKTVRVRKHYRRPPKKADRTGLSGLQLTGAVAMVAAGAWLFNRLGGGPAR